MTIVPNRQFDTRLTLWRKILQKYQNASGSNPANNLNFKEPLRRVQVKVTKAMLGSQAQTFNRHTLRRLSYQMLWAAQSGGGGGGGGTDPAVTSWAARAVANGGAPTAATQTALNNFVLGCKADGVWNDILICNCFISDDRASMNTPLVKGPGPDPWTLNQAGDVLTVNGYRPNNNAQDLGITPASIFASNTSAGFVFYVSQDRNGAANIAQVFNGFCGAYDAGPPSAFMVEVGAIACWTYYYVVAMPDLGYYSMQRDANGTHWYFANSATTHNLVYGDASALHPVPNSETLKVLDTGPSIGTARYQGGVSFCACTNGLTPNKSFFLYTRVQALRTALGGGFK